jgi:hypothetical protein
MSEVYETGLGNGDGSLSFAKRDGRCFIELDGDRSVGFYREIPEALFDMLVAEFRPEIEAERAEAERSAAWREEMKRKDAAKIMAIARGELPPQPLKVKDLFEGASFSFKPLEEALNERDTYPFPVSEFIPTHQFVEAQARMLREGVISIDECHYWPDDEEAS